jgi:hypothetical protein
MGDIRRTRLTVKGGVIYEADALARAAGLLQAATQPSPAP